MPWNFSIIIEPLLNCCSSLRESNIRIESLAQLQQQQQQQQQTESNILTEF
jgi:hypothetical protein